MPDSLKPIAQNGRTNFDEFAFDTHSINRYFQSQLVTNNKLNAFNSFAPFKFTRKSATS